MNGLIQHLATLADFSFNEEDVLTCYIGSTLSKTPSNYPTSEKCILYMFDSYDGYNYQSAGFLISKFETTNSSYKLLTQIKKETTNYLNPRVINYGGSLKVQYTDRYSQTQYSNESFGVYLKP